MEHCFSGFGHVCTSLYIKNVVFFLEKIQILFCNHKFATQKQKL